MHHAALLIGILFLNFLPLHQDSALIDAKASSTKLSISTVKSDGGGWCLGITQSARTNSLAANTLHCQLKIPKLPTVLEI